MKLKSQPDSPRQDLQKKTSKKRQRPYYLLSKIDPQSDNSQWMWELVSGSGKVIVTSGYFKTCRNAARSISKFERAAAAALEMRIS